MDKLTHHSPDKDQPTELREQFLGLVREDLKAGLTPFELQDHIDEVRSHLVASSAAYESMGLDPVEAMHAAIKSLGNDPEVNRELIVQSRKSDHPLWLASLFGVVSGMICCIVINAVLITFRDGEYLLSNFLVSAGIGSLAGLIVGSILGSRARLYGGPALRGAIASLIPFLISVGVVFSTFHRWPFAGSFIVGELIFWPIFGSCTAVLTQAFCTAFGKLGKLGKKTIGGEPSIHG